MGNEINFQAVKSHRRRTKTHIELESDWNWEVCLLTHGIGIGGSLQASKATVALVMITVMMTTTSVEDHGFQLSMKRQPASEKMIGREKLN